MASLDYKESSRKARAVTQRNLLSEKERKERKEGRKEERRKFRDQK